MAKIKLLKASSFYQDYLDLFYLNKINDRDLTFSELNTSLFDDGFAWSNSIKKYLEKQGSFEVAEFVINDRIQQKKWLEERNLLIKNPNDWILKTLELQIYEFKPDVLFAHDYSYINPSFIDKIKKNCPSIRLVVGYDGVAFNDLNLFGSHDLILSCLDFTCSYYASKGKKAYFMPYGFDAEVLKKVGPVNKQFDISFVGSLNMMSGGHHTRMKLLNAVAKKYKPSYFISGSTLVDYKFYQWPQRKRILNGSFSEALIVNRIGGFNLGPRYGLSMFEVMQDSKITLNSHIDLAKNRAANIRLFEATGMGCCLLSDWKENISDYFKPDEEIIAYKSTAECLEKIKFLLNNNEIRNKIALAGQKRTLKDHSMELRVKDLGDFLMKNHI